MIKNFKILDKYITKQIIETFLISLVIFTSIIFATDAFITIVKQITDYGIPLHIAALLVILKLPSMLILTIPMGMLLATLLTVNKMNNSLEITIMKACGVGLNRIAKPIFTCAIIATLIGFTVNEIIAPTASQLAKNVTIMSILQKNVPNGKQNFLFKEVNKETHMLKRFIHIASVKKNKFKNITVIDTTKGNSVQVIYAKDGDSEKNGWNLKNGFVYTISFTGKFLNSASFDKFTFDDTKDIINKINEVKETEFNFFNLKNYLKEEKQNVSKLTEEDLEIEENRDKKEKYKELCILLNEKIALPFTSIIFTLIAIPLSITGPRAKFNRGLIFSILILFLFYFIRAVALSLGQNEIIPFSLAAWLPNIILFILGFLLYRQKAYFI